MVVAGMSIDVRWNGLLIGTDRIEVRNYFKHRTDCLLSRIQKCKDSKVIESFAPGRQRSLKGTQLHQTPQCRYSTKSHNSSPTDIHWN